MFTYTKQLKSKLKLHSEPGRPYFKKEIPGHTLKREDGRDGIGRTGSGTFTF
jgi:hypothetical protein